MDLFRASSSCVSHTRDICWQSMDSKPRQTPVKSCKACMQPEPRPDPADTWQRFQALLLRTCTALLVLIASYSALSILVHTLVAPFWPAHEI